MYDSHIQLAKLFARCTVTERGCWEWDGPRHVTGYAKVGHGGSGLGHRAAWEITHGSIPKGALICHHCDVKPCVNPNHLFLGTQKDNMQDCLRKGRIARGDASGPRLYPEKRPRGEGHALTKIPDSQVREIRAIYALGGIGYAELGAKFGISKTQTARIVKNKSRRQP